MKLILIISALLLSTAARAESVGYVDINKALADTAEGKKALSDAEAVGKTAQSQYTAATNEAGKCAAASFKPTREKCEAEAKKKADGIQANAQEEQKRILAAAGQPLNARALRILPKLAAAHRLTGGISPSASMLYVPPKLDFTAELTKRIDAGEGKTEEEARADLQKKNADQAAEIAQLKAANAALAKPVAPAITSTTAGPSPLAAKPVAKK